MVWSIAWFLEVRWSFGIVVSGLVEQMPFSCQESLRKGAVDDLQQAVISFLLAEGPQFLANSGREGNDGGSDAGADATNDGDQIAKAEGYSKLAKWVVDAEVEKVASMKLKGLLRDCQAFHRELLHQSNVAGLVECATAFNGEESHVTRLLASFDSTEGISDAGIQALKPARLVLLGQFVARAEASENPTAPPDYLKLLQILDKHTKGTNKEHASEVEDVWRLVELGCKVLDNLTKIKVFGEHPDAEHSDKYENFMSSTVSTKDWKSNTLVAEPLAGVRADEAFLNGWISVVNKAIDDRAIDLVGLKNSIGNHLSTDRSGGRLCGPGILVRATRATFCRDTPGAWVPPGPRDMRHPYPGT